MISSSSPSITSTSEKLDFYLILLQLLHFLVHLNKMLQFLPLQKNQNLLLQANNLNQNLLPLRLGSFLDFHSIHFFRLQD